MLADVPPSHYNTTAATGITVVVASDDIRMVGLIGPGSWQEAPMQADLQAVDLVAEHVHLLLIYAPGAHTMRQLRAASTPQYG